MKLIDLHEDTFSPDTKLKYEELSLDECIKLIHEKCSNSAKLALSNNLFWRRDWEVHKALSVVNTENSRRKSVGDVKFYTEILDSHPEMKDFPKRERCLVSYGAINKQIVAYPAEPNIHWNILFPYDSAKIGQVHSDDIWFINIEIFGKMGQLSDLNDELYLLLKSLEIKFDTGSIIEALREADKLLKSSEHAQGIFRARFKNADDHDVLNFYDAILEAFSPKKTGLTCCSGKDFKADTEKQEIWTEGKIVVVKYHVLPRVLDGLRKLK